MDERRVAILARSDTYDGAERPGLGSEVAAELVGRARELEAATDIAGLRRLPLTPSHPKPAHRCTGEQP